MKTRVVHCKREPYDVMIDRTTMFGNPYHLGPDCTREQSIEKYRVYFYKRIHDDVYFLQAICELKGCVLGCWCKPRACHGDVIVEYLESS